MASNGVDKSDIVSHCPSSHEPYITAYSQSSQTFICSYLSRLAPLVYNVRHFSELFNLNIACLSMSSVAAWETSGEQYPLSSFIKALTFT
ncbi:MAG: hypothetical protein RLZZ574_2248 [Cyanobacteriota bacterium]